jgi:transcriptional regulator with XRE-family HTH domain
MKNTPVKEPDFADKMKALRKKRGISFEDLADKTGYEADYLEKVENKEVTPSVASVIQISRVLSIESGSFLSADGKESRKRKSEVFRKRTEAYAYRTLTPHAEQKHMKGFLVNIEAEAEHKGVEYHHPGEELVYVLNGELEIRVGNRTHKLEKGGSLHFDSSLIHKLRNPGKSLCELLVVVYTP